MERDAAVQEGLRRSNARFMASMNSILERYNHPFEDDLLVSMDTLTYDTPDGPKRWGQVSKKDVKKWKKKIFKHNRQSQRNREISEQQSSDFEDEHSTVHQESSENSGVDTSDAGEESDIVSVRRKFEDIHLQNLDVDDGQVQKKEIVQVDLIVQGDERNIPKWITVTSPGLLKSQHLTSPLQELIDDQAVVRRKKLKLSGECSSSKYLQLQHSDVPISSTTITTPRHQPCSELSKTLSDSIHGDYQSADEECSWSNTTLADLYPGMVEVFTRLMAKRSQRKVLKYMFGHLRSKRHSRRPKLNVTVDNIRRLGACKLKKPFHSICSCGSEDEQNPTFGNESREFCYDNCLISNSSGLAPYTDTNAIKMDFCDSSLEQHLASGKGQIVSKDNTAFPDVMARMGETFLVEDELPTTASPKNLEYTESEKMACKHFSEYSIITSPASSDSRALHLVKESKTQKSDVSCVDTSELCSSACSSHGNSNNSVPITNYSPARSSNTVLTYPEKIISERQTTFQHKHSFSSRFMNQSPSKMPHKYEDAFEELYYKVCSEEFQKSLTLTRPLLNSQDLEEKGRLVKSQLSDFVRSTKQCNTEFDRIYERLGRESVPKFPGFQRASNLRKYEEIQMPETVNALVNSPVRTYSAISRIKRAGNFQNSLPCSPTKRLKLIPEHYFSSRKCQDFSHRKMVNLQTAGMDFLSTYNCSNPSFFADHSCHCQDSGFHDSSDKGFLGIPGTSLQESGSAGAHSGWPGAMENCSSPRNVRKCHKRVYRKLSYTDGKDQW
ncbi:Holliday junction recognition protein isoform X1 [Corvus cornix cornix]|uniref:Holliday junction recognition protein isoform X1 n=1 Tax=Corvus cornix cornix TaxID=932674 RepID=UPI00195222A8|nr:Holliday junction recognition protein isoform X1 [Corvus cornix cornix]